MIFLFFCCRHVSHTEVGLDRRLVLRFLLPFLSLFLAGWWFCKFYPFLARIDWLEKHAFLLFQAKEKFENHLSGASDPVVKDSCNHDEAVYQVSDLYFRLDLEYNWFFLPFSSKFSKKIYFIYALNDLGKLICMDQVEIPDEVLK